MAGARLACQESKNEHQLAVKDAQLAQERQQLAHFLGHQTAPCGGLGATWPWVKSPYF